MRRELLLGWLVLCAALLATGCERERRRFDPPPLPPHMPEPRTVSLHVGPASQREPGDVSQAAVARAGAGASAVAAGHGGLDGAGG